MRSRVAWTRYWGIASLVAGLSAAQAADQPQAPPAEFSVGGGLTATDNANLAAAGERRADLITSVRPSVRWRRRSAGLDLDLDAAADLLGYANGTQRNSILPDVRATLRTTVIDQWLKIDAATRVKQTEVDTFGTRADDAQTANRRTEGSYSVRPHVERLLATNTLLLAAYDASVTTNGAGTGDRAVSRRGVGRLEHLPDPFGAAVEWSRLDSQTNDVQSQRLTVQTARASGRVALAREWVLGVIAGQERSRFLGSEHTDPVYGIDVKWDPSPRTSAAVNVEHRFFGLGGAVVASHRTPFLSMGASFTRQPAFSSSASKLLNDGANLRNYLDAILTTRYPDQGDRQGVVDSLVKSQGLDTRVPTSSDIVSDYPQLETALAGHLTLLGRRDVVSLTVFSRTARLLTHRGEEAPASLPLNSDARQVGASLNVSHRVTRQVSADVMVRWYRITGLADRSGDVSREAAYRASLLRNVSQNWTVSAGIQHRRFATTINAQRPYRATMAFVGASYQF